MSAATGDRLEQSEQCSRRHCWLRLKRHTYEGGKNYTTAIESGSICDRCGHHGHVWRVDLSYYRRPATRADVERLEQRIADLETGLSDGS